jgi:hypothetical protein
LRAVRFAQKKSRLKAALHSNVMIADQPSCGLCRTLTVLPPNGRSSRAYAHSQAFFMDVTRTLEVIPRQWKVIEAVREKFSCRDCEKISQAPAPFHAIARGWAGPSLLAMIMFEKFGHGLRSCSRIVAGKHPRSQIRTY